MESAHSVQVVSINEDHTYTLNEKELEKILKRDDIKDLPVAMVSVVGAYRGGKSFLLNFFIRYLSASPSARSDGSWLGQDSADLIGFTWQGGSVRVTTGILMWSEPFVLTLPSGEKVAVLLMDTQGTFDSSSTVKDNSTIFALSSLISSTQIYNVKNNINEDDLQNLQLFVDYGKLVKDDSKKIFQVLTFLVRDWINPWEYAYGEAGGAAYLAQKFKTSPDQQQELRELREHTLAAFEKVTCFLMPHPGMQVANPKFKGKISEISQEFTQELKELTTSIFGPENLCMKKINGQFIKSCELLNYFKSYIPIFNSSEIPSPSTISEATINAGLLMAANEVRDQFERDMDRECGQKAPSMPGQDLITLHQQILATARASFTDKMLLGDKEIIDKTLSELMQELIEKQKDYSEINRLKTLKAIENGNEAYDKVFKAVTKDQQLCVNALDLLQLQNDAVTAALNAFNENRRVASNGFDPDKDKYSQDLSAKYEELKRTNEHNNRTMIAELKSEYLEYMIAQVQLEPCADRLNNSHARALSKALEEFEARRNLPNTHTQDTYKTDLIQRITVEHIQVMQIGENRNHTALASAIANFMRNSIKPNDLRYSCKIPEILKQEHERVARQAFGILSMQQVCDRTKKDLQAIMDRHFNDLKAVNASSNEQAVTSAYWTYRNKFNALCDHWYYAFETWNKIREYHNQALEEAKRDFYIRREPGYGYYDYYLNNLLQRCEDYYRSR